MADITETAETQDQGAQTGAAAQSEQERTFTQDEVNKLVAERLKRERSKHEGYISPEKAAETAEKAAQAAERAAKAEAELAAYKAAEERAKTVSEVAADTGVPSDVVALLNGKDGDELAEQVGKLLSSLQMYPARVDDGGSKNTAKQSKVDSFFSGLGLDR